MSGCKESVQCVWAYLHSCETARLIPLLGVGGCKKSVRCVWTYVHPCETTRLILYPSWVMSGCKESVQCVWAYLHPCEIARLIPLMGGGVGVRRVCNVCVGIFTPIRDCQAYTPDGGEWV